MSLVIILEVFTIAASYPIFKRNVYKNVQNLKALLFLLPLPRENSKGSKQFRKQHGKYSKIISAPIAGFSCFPCSSMRRKGYKH
eukprot:1127841-Amphidinium_carterae.1